MLLCVQDRILTTEIDVYILPYIYIVDVVKEVCVEQSFLLFEEFQAH